MYISSILSYLLMSSAAVSAASIPRVLDESKLILYGENGRMEVVDKAEYFAKHFSNGTRPLKSNYTSIYHNSNSTNSKFSKRCKSASIITEYPVQNFLNWDVPMSSAIKAGATTATVAVTEGYQISNAIAISESAALTVVQDFLTVNYGVTYTETWTSSYAAAYTFTVPAGKYGIVVSNPSTTRRSGRVDIGCVGEATDTVTYSADSYQSRAYGGLSWVLGTISLCTGDSYPVKQCQGEDYLY